MTTPESPKEPCSRKNERAVKISESTYRTLLRAYPCELRDEYGDEMTRCFQDLCREKLEDGGSLGLVALWSHTLPELLYTALKERIMMLTKNAYRVAVGMAIAAVLMLIWLSLGVGIIGRDGDPANLMYFGVPAVGIIGAFSARFRPRGMARALFAAALAQALVAVIALMARLGYPWSGPLELAVLNGFFVALFVGSALLFRYAARKQMLTGAG